MAGEGTQESVVSGGVYDPSKLLSDKGGDFGAVGKVLLPTDILKEVLFNAPAPSHLWQGWPKFSSEYAQSQALSPGASKQSNAPGFIVLDEYVYKAVDNAATTDPSTAGTDKAGAPAGDPYGAMRRKSRWGFRFHFNPSQFGESYQRRMDVNYVAYIQDISRNESPPVALDTGASLQLSLLLSRRDDMHILMRDDYANFYPPGMDEEKRSDILQRGTMHDVEYLYRVVNGDPWNTWHGSTADYGMLMPMAVTISLGNSPGARKIRGTISKIDFTHQQFSPGMVPVYTEVNISVNRLPDMYSESVDDSTQVESAAIAATGGVKTPSADAASGSPTPPVPGGAQVTNGTWGLPVPSPISVTSPFGEWRRTYAHEGIDCGVTIGTPVMAMGDGKVIQTNPPANEKSLCLSVSNENDKCGGGYGNYVYIYHPSGFLTVYAHLSRPLVAMGQTVKMGDVIGLSGSSGSSGGPHLHVSLFRGQNVDVKSNAIDPNTAIPFK